MEKTTSKIIHFIMDLSGAKIVTIGQPGCDPMKFDISETGRIGYRFSHVHLFNMKVNECLISGGTIIVRQFTNMHSHMQNDIPVPYKNIYGFDSNGFSFMPIYDYELQAMFCNVEQEEKINPERGVFFRNVDIFEDLNSDGYVYGIDNHHLKLDNFNVRKDGWMDSGMREDSEKRIVNQIDSIILNDVGGFKYTGENEIDLLFLKIVKQFTMWVMFDDWPYSVDEAIFDSRNKTDYAFIEDTLEFWIDNAIHKKNKAGNNVVAGDANNEYYYENYHDEIRLDIRALGEEIFEKMSLGDIDMTHKDFMEYILENEWNIYNAICKIQAKDAFRVSYGMIINDLNKDLYKV